MEPNIKEGPIKECRRAIRRFRGAEVRIKNMPMTKRAIMRIDYYIVGLTGQVKYRIISALAYN